MIWKEVNSKISKTFSAYMTKHIVQDMLLSLFLMTGNLLMKIESNVR